MDYKNVLNVYHSGEHVADVYDLGSEASLIYANPNVPRLSLSLRTDETSQRVRMWLREHLPSKATAALTYPEADFPSLTFFQTLGLFGQDVFGAFTFTNPTVGFMRRYESAPVTISDISSRVISVKNNSSVPRGIAKGVRLSLGGAQEKFSLHYSKNDKTFYTSSYELPSTHIFKPGSLRHLRIDTLEHATLTLANRCGIQTANTGIFAPNGYDEIDYGCFYTERFDRYYSNGFVHRRHAETLTQALGVPVKYTPFGDKHVTTLREVDVPDSEIYKLFSYIVFNTHVGNADGHLQNYSIYPETSTITPLYDSLPTTAFHGYQDTLPTPINGLRYSKDINLPDWKEYGRTLGLNADTCQNIAESVVRSILNNVEHAFRSAGLDSFDIQTVYNACHTIRKVLK